ncbi:hypothetical protein BHM03_00058566 [Ensete ventricosum]|nr:hypothetical protein BHM03_00058566 [Ensete ventricosum]
MRVLAKAEVSLTKPGRVSERERKASKGKPRKGSQTSREKGSKMLLRLTIDMAVMRYVPLCHEIFDQSESRRDEKRPSRIHAMLIDDNNVAQEAQDIDVDRQP